MQLQLWLPTLSYTRRCESGHRKEGIGLKGQRLTESESWVSYTVIMDKLLPMTKGMFDAQDNGAIELSVPDESPRNH